MSEVRFQLEPEEALNAEVLAGIARCYVEYLYDNGTYTREEYLNSLAQIERDERNNRIYYEKENG